jgi:hypothetical protein
MTGDLKVNKHATSKQVGALSEAFLAYARNSCKAC